MYVSEEQVALYVSLYLKEKGVFLSPEEAYILLNKQLGLMYFLLGANIDPLIHSQEESVGICRICLPKIMYEEMLENSLENN